MSNYDGREKIVQTGKIIYEIKSSDTHEKLFGTSVCGRFKSFAYLSAGYEEAKRSIEMEYRLNWEEKLEREKREEEENALQVKTE